MKTAVIGMVVRLCKPCEGEEGLKFVVTNVNEVTKRVYITMICDDFIKPSELVSINDIELI